MATIILIIHLMLAIALVAVVLLQRSEGGALGIGGGGGGMSGLMTGRSAANVLTRTTAVLAAMFIGTSLLLAILASEGSEKPRSVIEQMPPAGAPTEPAVPTPEAAPATPEAPAPDQPEDTGRPAEPAVPLAE